MSYELTPQDWERNILDGWVGVEIDDTIRPMKVINIRMEDGDDWDETQGAVVQLEGKIGFSGSDYITSEVWSNDPNLLVEWPLTGSFNMEGGGVMSIYRNPQRQWKEVIHLENSVYVDSFREEREYLRMNRIKNVENISILTAAFNNKFFTPQEALEKVGNVERLAATFHRDWYIGWKIAPNSPCLFYRDRPIAKIVDRVVKLKPNLIFFKEEIESFGMEVSVT